MAFNPQFKINQIAKDMGLKSKELTDLLADHELARLIRLIPVHSATGEGLLPAVIPEEVRVTDRCTTYSGDQLIAISDLGEEARDFDAVMANG